MRIKDYCFYVFFVMLATSNVFAKKPELQIAFSSEAYSKILYGIETVQQALSDNYDIKRVVIDSPQKPDVNTIYIGTLEHGEIYKNAIEAVKNKPEAFSLVSDGDSVIISGVDDGGVFYGCLEFSQMIKQLGGVLPKKLHVSDYPCLSHRAVGIPLQNNLYDDIEYDSLYTPENYPWFYDKNWWIDTLDRLAKYRFNYIEQF